MDRPELRPQDGKGQVHGGGHRDTQTQSQQQTGPLCVEIAVSLVWRLGPACSLGLFCPKQLIPIHLTSRLVPKWLSPGSPSCPP